ncbi:MAG TPA: outer membrane beta-barrel family protein [Chitinophagaceae bacterium]|nr:outer membrane beta-barrel family protein [Chitinophagaceae bacterium]
MRKLLLFAIFSITVLSIQAQFPGGGRPGGGNGQSMNMGRVYGKIVEAKTNKGLEGVSVQFIQNKFDTVTRKRKDTVLAGMFTRNNGDFALESLPMFGNFRLKISAIGFKPIEQKVAFEMKGGDMSQALSAIDKDLGNIKMDADAQVLEQVTVSGQKSLVQLGVDRKVFNVERNMGSVGGTAVDVMRNVPSVSVDIDGNVTLRNNSPQIFVDGRPSTLTLEQIPADAIASIEIITNPSAKFDASGGTAGILNIVLKKNRKAGYNGNLRAGIDSRLRANLGGDINVRQGKVNVFANTNFNQRKSIANGTTDRLTLNTTPNSISHQVDRNESRGQFAFARLGMDYFIDNRNTITISGMHVRGKFEPFTQTDLFYNRVGSGKADTLAQRLATVETGFRNVGGMMSFKHNFPKAGKEWTADINFNRSRNNNFNTLVSNTYAYQGGPLLGTYTQLQDGGGTNKFITFQTDFTNPLGDKSKFETGFRMTRRNVDSRNIISVRLPNATVKEVDSLSSHYKNNEEIYAAYGTYSNQHKNLGYQLGLRVENSEYEGDLIRKFSGKDSVTSFSNNFPISLFPSVFLSQKLKNDQELQLNYTRRINRPNFFQLFPFIDFSDSLNLSQGNPNLRPEFTNSIEASYQKLFKGNSSILISAYYKNTNDLITRYAYDTVLTGQKRIINSFINANSSNVFGLEFTMRNSLAKWWELNTNLNLFSSKINTEDPAINEQERLYSFFGKLNNNFRLPHNITIQLTGDYTSKTILPPGGSGGGRGGFGGGGGFFGQSQSTSQGYIRPNYGVDIAVRYEFLKERRASISLSMNDVFKTRRSNIHSEAPSFIQDAFRRRDAQILRLNFSWRFGKFDATLFKRKNLRGEQEGMQGGMQGVQQ